MNGYHDFSTNRIERIKNLLVQSGSLSLPRTTLYRLCRRELTCKILKALGASSRVGTLYICEVTAEIVLAWFGNTIYISHPYLVRNWKTR